MLDLNQRPPACESLQSRRSASEREWAPMTYSERRPTLTCGRTPKRCERDQSRVSLSEPAKWHYFGTGLAGALDAEYFSFRNITWQISLVRKPFRSVLWFRRSTPLPNCLLMSFMSRKNV